MKDRNESENQERSALAKGYAWATLIISISLESALLVYFGYLLDKYLKTLPLVTLIASFLAIGVMMIRLFDLVKKTEDPK